MWDSEQIAEIAAEALIREDARLADEQAPLGVDALDELRLHPILRAGFGGAGFGVFPEHRYPSTPEKSRRSVGERCDMVLTHDPHRPPLDPRERESLFAVAATEPEEALWLEVKAVGQHVMFEGCCRPNPRYSTELVGGVSGDAQKLSREMAIVHAAALVALFCADRGVAEHDLGELHRRLLGHGVPVSAPETRLIDIRDTIGNACAAVALFRVHHL